MAVLDLPLRCCAVQRASVRVSAQRRTQDMLDQERSSRQPVPVLVDSQTEL
eukprot:COSAG01_NODE_1768_length_9274_cov_3.118583_1_plen_51_part_00